MAENNIINFSEQKKKHEEKERYNSLDSTQKKFHDNIHELQLLVRSYLEEENNADNEVKP